MIGILLAKAVVHYRNAELGQAVEEYRRIGGLCAEISAIMRIVGVSVNNVSSEESGDRFDSLVSREMLMP